MDLAHCRDRADSISYTMNLVMKSLLSALVVFSLTQVHAQIIPNAGVSSFPNVAPAGGGIGGPGIPAVTYPYLTQTSGTIVRNFFTASGVNLGGNPLNPFATPASTSTFGGGAATFAATDAQLKTLLNSREQLAKENSRLAGLIATKQQNQQTWAKEAHQRASVLRVIVQVEKRIAARLASLKSESAATESKKTSPRPAISRASDVSRP